MASIVVRGLDEAVKERLAERARDHGRSMEAEVRDILTRAAAGGRVHIGLALMKAGQESGGIEELPILDRSERARSVDFE